MSVIIKGMEMPCSCRDCRWFSFRGMSCTTPQYLLDARCELIPSGQDWYGKDKRGGWIGESIERIPGWGGRYSHMHCVENGAIAPQCPLIRIPASHGDLIDKDEIYDMDFYKVSLNGCRCDVYLEAERRRDVGQN